MTWFAAHVVMYIKYKSEIQKEYSVWENVYLFEAASTEEAYRKAEKRGKEEEGDSSGTLEFKGYPSIMVYAGVRKLIECQNSPDQLINQPVNDCPGDGSEISYSRFNVKNLNDIQQMIKGEPVGIVYEE